MSFLNIFTFFFFNLLSPLEALADFSCKLMGRIYFKFFEERFFLVFGVFLTALD